MPADNAEQIAEWNGALGQRWAELQDEIDGSVRLSGSTWIVSAVNQVA